MRLSIRTANLSGYSAFYRVAHEVYEHHVEAIPDVFQSVDVVVSENDFAQLVHGDDSDVYAAECNGEIVGYAVILYRHTSRDIHVPRTIAFIDNFGVLKASRRMGIGRLLFEACVNRAKEKGARNLELDCWEDNQEAVQFYSSMGLKLTRRWYSTQL
jgi:diamine N-acetyltransferase